ncbi:MAG: response regulator transcription factor [Clostridiaceae bacterium]|nr:response regulator transcription factor [Clostridiaceae bacterium]
MRETKDNGAPLRVLLADDDALVTRALKTILEASNISVVGMASNGTEAVALYRELQPDVLLMDIRMPGRSGLEAARELLRGGATSDATSGGVSDGGKAGGARASADGSASGGAAASAGAGVGAVAGGVTPAPRILLLTTFRDSEYLAEALALGCRGYLLKQNFASIIPSLRAVMAGNFVFDEEVVQSLTTETRVKTDPRLTERENEVLTRIALGENNRDIAAALFLSEGTVRNHVSSMLDKLGLRDRTQLAVYYYRELVERGI